jgi:ketosteroid isomerase-like protein
MKIVLISSGVPFAPTIPHSRESTVVLWQSLTFWTAVGQLAIGVLAGAIIAVAVRKARTFARPPAIQAHDRMCPGCGTPSLRRIRGSFPRRLLSVTTRRWPMVCLRCGWPSTPSTAGVRRPRGWRTDSSLRAIGDERVLYTPKALHPDWLTATERALNNERAHSAERAMRAEQALNAQLALSLDQAIESESIVDLSESMPETDAPETDAPETDAIGAGDTQAPYQKDDVAEIRDAVFRYLALLNSGDVATKASCSLSDSTSFGADGGPLNQNVLDWRAANLEAGEAYDLRCHNLRVYIHNDTAIATGYVVGTISRRNGTSRRVTGRASWVHLRQNGKWKLAHNHLSPLKAALV